MTESTSESQIDRLLERALDLPPAERERFLQQVGATDPPLRERLDKLLALAEQDGGFLERSPLRADAPSVSEAPPEEIGAAIGPFRLVRRLGAGGMGEVYLAERIEGGFRQRVALKLVRADAGAKPERFDAEREILAGLEHPGIARLYDGGVTADGRPYMAMEYVEGLDLLAYCEARRASLEQRLNLFLQVCEAVTYAHAHLVVHRDLKPANIFVTAEGQVKLLDFGIAKLLQPNVVGDATRTAHLSPAYAAPEQLTGGAITTATDVYALGVTLFQLLSGRLPWQVSELPLAAAVQRLIDQAPPRPSEAAAADAPVPAKHLRGDLDAIVAKALRKEPKSRYPDARALADDLTRHLRHEPVQALAGARTYVLRRFLRRHWLPWSAAAAVFAALVAGIAVALWQAQRAEREATRATATKEFLLDVFRASDPRIASDKPRGQITARELLDASAPRVEQEFAHDPETQVQLLDILATTYYLLGETQRAHELRQRHEEHALALYGELHPKVIKARLATVWYALGDGDLERAQTLLGDLDGQIHRAGRDRSVDRAEWWLAQSDALALAGAEASLQREALATSVHLYREDLPEASGHEMALLNLGVLELKAGDPRSALAWCDEALAIHSRVESPRGQDLAKIHYRRALALEKLGELAGARAAMAQALSQYRRTIGLRYAGSDEVIRDAERLGLRGEALDEAAGAPATSDSAAANVTKQ